MKRIVFLCSSRGSNFEAAVNYLRKIRLKVEIVGMITDNPTAGAIQLAEKFKIRSYTIPFKNYKSEPGKFHQELLKTIQNLKPDLIVTAGYMRILQPEIIKQFKNQIINIHPSLLPAFSGLHAQKQAIDYGTKISGCTSHFVDETVDTGPIILQAVVPIKDGMNEAELSREILKEEHRILPKSIELFCEGKLKINGRRVTIHE